MSYPVMMERNKVKQVESIQYSTMIRNQQVRNLNLEILITLNKTKDISPNSGAWDEELKNLKLILDKEKKIPQ